MAARSARIQPRRRGVQSAMIPLRPLLATLLASAALHAGAHDTWFEPLPAGENEVLLALGTGTQYPKLDTSLDARYLAQQGCSTAGEAAATRMRPVRNTHTALVLRAPRDAASCWAQLMPFEVEIPAATVEVYFKDIQATAEVRAAWAAMRQRGLPWQSDGCREGSPSALRNVAARSISSALSMVPDNWQRWRFCYSSWRQ